MVGIVLKEICPWLFIRLVLAMYHHQNPGYMELVKDNVEFKDKHKGKRCFIIGNGPSINNLDFSALENEYVFTVNQLPRNPNYSKLKTNYHFWGDERVFDFDESSPESLEIIDVMKNVNDGNNPIVFYPTFCKSYIDKFKLNECLNIRYFAKGNLDRALMLKRELRLDRVIPNFSTVIQYVICSAVYMGFSEIYLLGCDCTGFITDALSRMHNAENAQYGYEITNNEKKRIEKAVQKTTIEDELTWYAELFKTYKLINEYCAIHRVRLYNLTEGGLLDSIERVDINDVLKKINVS